MGSLGLVTHRPGRGTSRDRRTCSAVEEQATRTIARVDDRLGDLQRMKAALSDLVEACRAGTDSGECPILRALDA